MGIGARIQQWIKHLTAGINHLKYRTNQHINTFSICLQTVPCSRPFNLGSSIYLMKVGLSSTLNHQMFTVPQLSSIFRITLRTKMRIHCQLWCSSVSCWALLGLAGREKNRVCFDPCWKQDEEGGKNKSSLVLCKVSLGKIDLFHSQLMNNSCI